MPKKANKTPNASMKNPRPAGTAEVLLFADGACSGNPGPGGWAFILRHPATGKELERAGAERQTTNNRMELTAVIRGLESLKRPTSVELVTDSTYVGKGLTEWMAKWKANGWRRREGDQWKEVKNEELWRRLDELLTPHKSGLRTFAAIRAIPRTNAAIPWPWRRTRSTCDASSCGEEDNTRLRCPTLLAARSLRR